MAHTFRGAFWCGLLAMVLCCALSAGAVAVSPRVAPWHVVLFSDGTQFVAYQRDSTLTLYRTADGSVARQFEAPGSVWSIALSPAEKRLLVVCDDGTLVLWDVQSGERIWQSAFAETALRVPAWFAGSASFAGNGERFVCPTWDGALVFDARTGARIRRIIMYGQSTEGANAVALAPDGTRGFLLTPDGHLHSFDVATGRTVETGIIADGWHRYCSARLPHRSGGRICYSADGKFIAFPTLGDLHNDQLAVVQLGDKLTRRNLGWFGEIGHLRVAADGSFLVSAGTTRFREPSTDVSFIGVRIWPTEGRTERLWLSTRENGLYQRTDYSLRSMIAVTPGSDRGIAKITDLRTGKVVLAIGEFKNDTIKAQPPEKVSSDWFWLWIAAGAFVLIVAVAVVWRWRVKAKRPPDRAPAGAPGSDSLRPVT
jgi:WD40 repeat protein